MLSNPVEEVSFGWADTVRRVGSSSMWVIIRRSYLSEDKNNRSSSEVFLRLAISVMPDPPSEYTSIPRRVKKTWSSDVESGKTPFEHQLAFALGTFPGLANPAVFLRRRTVRDSGVSSVLTTLLFGTKDPSSSLFALKGA